MANQYSANRDGAFTGIDSSDVNTLAGQLAGKPDNSAYTVGTNNIVGTLDLGAANIAASGTYKLTYTYTDGTVAVEGNTELQGVGLKSSFAN